MTGPSDLVIFSLIVFGLFTWIVLTIGRRAKSLRPIYNHLAEALQTTYPQNKTPEPKIVTLYDGIGEDALDKIVSNIIGVLTVVGATYGVLFALVVSEKASLAFSSWAFVIWCGWVLALLMRICNCGTILLGDYNRCDRRKREQILYGIVKFTKHSAYLLVLTASFVPLFATMKTISLDEVVTNYPWGQDVSLFLGVLSIASVAVFFYTFVLALGNLTKRLYADIYMYAVMLLWGIGLGSISLSPLAPVTSRILGLSILELTAPSILTVLGALLFWFAGLSIAIAVILGLLARTIWRLCRTIRTR